MSILYHTYFQKSYTICTKMNFIYLQIGGGKSIIIYKRKGGEPRNCAILQAITYTK